MAYFLGRDVKVAITTEDADVGIGLEATSDALEALDVESGATSADDYVSADTLFAGPLACNDAGTDSVFNSQTAGTSGTPTYSNEIADLTGVDLSMGVTDEDVVYMGQRQVLKAEIKKETTVTVTRKKGDRVWEEVFNSARWGVNEAGTGIRANIAGQPDDIGFGYRAYIKMKDTAEVFIIRNACIQSHSVTLNPDGITEETMELMTYVDPIIVSADAVAMIAATDAGDL
jgi:hypothetical protein